MGIDEDIIESKQEKKAIRVIRNPFKFIFVGISSFFKWIGRSFYTTFLKTIIKGHEKRSQLILDYIQLVKKTYDELMDNKMKKQIAKNVKEIRKREEDDEKLTKELTSYRNQLVQMILDSGKVFDLQTKEGKEINEEYLYNLNIDELIDKTNTLYTKLKRLDT